MAIKLSGMEGNEFSQNEYARKEVSQGAWGNAWETLKGNLGKLVLLNFLLLVCCVPAIAVIWIRSSYLTGLGSAYPFNTSIVYPFYPDTIGLAESVKLSADIMFYGLLIATGFFIAIGLSGVIYCVRRMLVSSCDNIFKNFLHGIKIGYLNTALGVVFFLLFFYATKLIGSWMDYTIAIGGNAAGAITAYVFIIIATVLVGIYSAWLVSVGTTYKLKPLQLLKNSFVMVLANPIMTIFFAAFALLPVWFYMIGNIMTTISYIIFIIIGLSFMVFVWTAYTQSLFDKLITPAIKVNKEKEKATKSIKEQQEEKEKSDLEIARELLAAGRSEVIARPILPVEDKLAVSVLSSTFTRGDLKQINSDREKLKENISNYEEEHKNDTLYAEYNRLFAEREKALNDEDSKKGKKKKKISSDNLLK